MGEQLQLLVWESEIQAAGDGRAVVIARKPLSRMSVGQAARLLGCSRWTVRKLYRLGLLSGWKPGAAVARSDGRASSANLVLDAGSVLSYKESVSQRGEF